MAQSAVRSDWAYGVSPSRCCAVREACLRARHRTLTTSQPRSLLSMARSKRARSRSRSPRSSQNRMAHTCCGFSARLEPTTCPAFQACRSRAAGSYSVCPIVSSIWPDWPVGVWAQGKLLRAREIWLDAPSNRSRQYYRSGWLSDGLLAGRDAPRAEVGSPRIASRGQNEESTE
jgi:hypothetical protein